MAAGAAIVTGGGSGMGQAAAWRLAAQGRGVAVVDLNQRGMDETAARHPDLITTHVVDVSDRAAVAALAKDVRAAHGTITRIVNAAGIVRTGRILEQDPNDLDLTMRVNFDGVANMCLEVMPEMVARGSGEVINFASLMGWIPGPKLGAYAASKAAVVAYTEVLWMENRGTGVKVVCVCPPAVATPMLGDFIPDQANHKKAMPMSADKVIDAIERGLARDRLWVFPGAAKVMWRLRRHTPRLVRATTRIKRFDIIGEPG